MRRTLYNAAEATESIAVAAHAATVTGTSVDRGNGGAGESRSAMLIVHAGAVTDGTHTVELQESDDNSDFTAVAGSDLQGAEPELSSANDGAVFEVGYTGAKRYLRAVVTVAGATTGGVYGAVIQLGFGSAPVTR